ncbi:hypothetical protein [Mammaliicoccus sciuri]|uniref:hypothetical protein n=2 Tax=Staphylococcaceae TaxID=90964 RepID=UPI001330C6DE|nr:hypothetical protein [Mammaliicoccus sciuri]MDT0709454.1 hypothetical protein [Mammaliicoccus sciuri]MDT0756550.1 hypothetical protein [Mammaliicoccus sciuri]
MEFLELFTRDLLFWQILIVVFGSIVIKKISFPKLHHVEMNQKSTKALSILSNFFIFIMVSIMICMLILLTLSEVITQISIKEMKEHQQTFYGYLIFLFMYSMYFALLLSPIWIKKRKFFLLELINKDGEKKYFKLSKRLNYNGIDNLIYEDEDGKIHEETVEDIKSREGRLVFIPKYKWVFDISTNNFKEFEILPLIWRRVIYSVLFLLAIYILWLSIASIFTLWSTNLEISLIKFKLLMTCPSILFTTYIIVGGYKLYSLWFGRRKIPYRK